MKDWTNRLKVGDIVRFPSGMLRTVRRVKHPDSPTDRRGNKYRSSVTFSIQACSWTGRCYTCYTSSDLRTMGCRPTRARNPLRTKLDRKICAAMASHEHLLKCCDVIGVVQ